MATSPSGKARACKALIVGSIPTVALRSQSKTGLALFYDCSWGVFNKRATRGNSDRAGGNMDTTIIIVILGALLLLLGIRAQAEDKQADENEPLDAP